MKRFFLLLASAVLLVFEAPAARMSLLDLIGAGSRRSSRSKQSSAGDRRRAVRVEHGADSRAVASNAVQEAAAPAAANADASAVAAVPASTNWIDMATCDEAAAGVSTNAVPETATNAVGRATERRQSRPAHISSRRVYYDRKEGYAVFTGRVHVDGEEYQLHADKAYVFFEGTNELKRVVATGGVAITNDTKRAYGAKASYYRSSGMVVLYGDGSAPAEVRNEDNGENQVVKGSAIKFWMDSEQVEVVDARISAPVSGGLGELKGAINGK